MGMVRFAFYRLVNRESNIATLLKPLHSLIGYRSHVNRLGRGWTGISNSVYAGDKYDT